MSQKKSAAFAFIVKDQRQCEAAALKEVELSCTVASETGTVMITLPQHHCKYNSGIRSSA
jgi:hypothetical protein